MEYTVTLSNQDIGTILAALRFYQLKGGYQALQRNDLEDIATDDGEFDALGSDEIDRLCERINCT